MISYEVYKVLHLNMLFLTLCSIGAAFASEQFAQKKLLKIITHVMSFIIFVAGMGLIARIGIQHGAGFPIWIKIKIVMWFLFTGSAVMIFKLKNKKHKLIALIIAIVSAIVASSSAVTKFLA